ncbi:hypothetical protein PoB_006659000 [Plakobranchus ocellatus]|uniref:Uncharacterized protein n=1 Tax=Plakobranchus ocellatus TaxID=259542 RepID=A0AAV4D7Q6_9GAST|nr:hypothetical protein PoB_006659000 [Plakobranchus ocellatus]
MISSFHFQVLRRAKASVAVLKTRYVMVLEDHIASSYSVCHQCPLLLLKLETRGSHNARAPKMKQQL